MIDNKEQCLFRCCNKKKLKRHYYCRYDIVFYCGIAEINENGKKEIMYCPLCRAKQRGIQSEWQRILKIIDEHQNPYPKDIFVWDNKEKLDFNRGRFNRHCFEIVEFTKEELKQTIKGEKGE